MSLLVMVEIPRGSRNKYEYDCEQQRFYLDRMLFSSVHYPTDYGFIPKTLAEDGDALDALVIVGEATFPGCYIRVEPVGVFEMWDEKGPDQKILCVPVSDPQWNWVQRLDDVPHHLLKEITHFFEVYKDLEKKETKVGDWLGKEEALKIVAEAQVRYAQAQ
ncbi:MAG TPA: inorganic diphosphatase [Firmicutes bacterium]|nr:inorganic diphosphatase [Bacillota bacterium]